MSNTTVYKTDSGYEPTALSAGTALAATAIDLEGIAAVGGVDRDALASGVFDNARVYVFKCDFLNPVEDYEEVTVGLFGKTTLEDEHYRIEGMGLIDALNQTVGKTYTALCSRTFGDAWCGVDVGALSVTGTLSHVSGSNSIRDSARTEAADYFCAGTLRFTSGANSGLRMLEIKSHASDGSIVTHEPFYYLPSVGDSYVMTPGCRKRKEDCTAWDNVENAMAFWDIPTGSTYTQIGGVNT